MASPTYIPQPANLPADLPTPLQLRTRVDASAVTSDASAGFERAGLEDVVQLEHSGGSLPGGRELISRLRTDLGTEVPARPIYYYYSASRVLPHQPTFLPTNQPTNQLTHQTLPGARRL